MFERIFMIGWGEIIALWTCFTSRTWR